MTVLVIGAGLGGLCLAHGLRGAGIDVTVLERGPHSGAQPASYGIHLDADGLAALHACLPAPNWQRLVGAAEPALDVVRFRDEQLRVLAERDHEACPANADPVTRRRAVRRDVLRDALLHGLAADGVVHWGRRFQRYEQLADGRVQVECDDGARFVGDLVVGADGSNSRVRAQRLPGLQRQDLGILNIAGRVPLTPGVRAQLPDTLVDGSINNVVPARPGWMFVSTWKAGSADEVDEYAVWAWAARRDSYPADVATHARSALLDLVRERIEPWSSPLSALLEHTDVDSVATVPLRTMPQLPDWSPEAVTLLGDAIHNMTPMAGIGANTALRDADTLRRALAGADGDLLTRVGRYEARMREYANQALALSTRNARNATSPARLPRAAFRTVLRIAEAVPPVKRKVFSSPPRERTA